jgi:hypothetical protein
MIFDVNGRLPPADDLWIYDQGSVILIDDLIDGRPYINIDDFWILMNAAN